jgi:site-specific recombinase XerD
MVFRQLFPEESVPVSEIADIPDPILQMTDCLRIRHYSRSTEKTYLSWCRRYLDYSVNSNQDPRSDKSFRAFITSLALKERVSASAQNQAFNALLFLFRYIWNTEPAGIDAVRARKGVRLPSVLSQMEVASLLGSVSGTGSIFKYC